uniref:GDNF family receptor alpha-3 n=1 Tax=Rhinolophus ferrumequinum TaxID=59479 RepID=A0A671EQB0_RHIFE
MPQMASLQRQLPHCLRPNSSSKWRGLPTTGGRTWQSTVFRAPPGALVLPRPHPGRFLCPVEDAWCSRPLGVGGRLPGPWWESVGAVCEEGLARRGGRRWWEVPPARRAPVRGARGARHPAQAERPEGGHQRALPTMARPRTPRPPPPVLLLLLLPPLPLLPGAGDYELDVSPYEDTVTRKPWKMNPNKLKKLKPDWDLCLKFAMLCTLNGKCGRLRKAYGEACSGPRCQRHTCQRQLRTFFEKASEPHAQSLLLCPCAPADLGCGQRRRNTIAPSCALPAGTPNCLELRRRCLSDVLCRSRLADFQTHCHPMDGRETCATDKSRCLLAYTGLIGTAMTPNFVSNVNASVALSCTCRGSGNLQEECERLEASFSHNRCLTEAIAAKMRLHSQLFSQASPVMEHQKNSAALRPQPWVPSLFSFTLALILLPSFW